MRARDSRRPFGRDVGQEAEPAEVDPEHGDAGVRGGAGSDEHGPVAADHDEQVDLPDQRRHRQAHPAGAERSSGRLGEADRVATFREEVDQGAQGLRDVGAGGLGQQADPLELRRGWVHAALARHPLPTPLAGWSGGAKLARVPGGANCPAFLDTAWGGYE